MPKQCPVCAKTLTPNLAGRAKRYCSNACRDSARRAFNFQLLGRTRPEPRNDSKNPHGSRTFLLENPGRASGIAGPKHVIDIELGGLDWREKYPNGTMVAQLKPPALKGTA
jgi:hypothetical protein